MSIQIRSLTVEEVRTFLSWEYSEPYDMYNMSSTGEEEDFRFFMDPESGYFAIANETDEMIGFCNFGADAQVPGGVYDEDAVDIGMGLRPDLTGLGQGHLYAAAVFDFANQHFPHQKQRVTIAKFNKRAQRLCAKFGFAVQSEFEKSGDGRPFLILVRENEIWDDFTN